MMRHLMITATIAFLLGLSIGNLAFGQREDRDLPVDTRQSESPASASDSTVALSGAESPYPPLSIEDSESLSQTEVGQGDGPINIELGPMSESEQIQVMMSRWTNMESLVEGLEQRIGGLEEQITTLKSERLNEREEAKEEQVEALPLATPQDRRVALVAAGVPQTTAVEIVRWQSELALERLELQDRAMREDWYQTDRYYEALRALNDDVIDLRSEIGEQAYDHYLYQTGESNRVKVTSVIQGSAAEQHGFLPGDIIERYGDEQIYDYSDLRSATSMGDRGEIVPIIIRRGDTLIEASITRGPMGVRLDAESAPPNG